MNKNNNGKHKQMYKIVKKNFRFILFYNYKTTCVSAQ